MNSGKTIFQTIKISPNYGEMCMWIDSELWMSVISVDSIG